MRAVALVVLAGLTVNGVERIHSTNEIGMCEIDTGIEDRNADAQATRVSARKANSCDAGGNDLRRSTAASSWLAFRVLVGEERTIRNDGQYGWIVPQGDQSVRIRHSNGRGIDAAEVHTKRSAGPAHDRSPGRSTGPFTEPHDVAFGTLGECDTRSPLHHQEHRDDEPPHRRCPRPGTFDNGSQALDPHSVSSPEVDHKSPRP